MKRNEYTFCGNALKCEIKRRKETLEKVASEVGINKNTLNKATNSGQVNIDSLIKICNHLQIHPSDLFIKNVVYTDQEPDSTSQAYLESIEEEVKMLRNLHENYLNQIRQLEEQAKRNKKTDKAAERIDTP